MRMKTMFRVSFLILVLVLVIGCAKEISQEEAIVSAQSFVNNYVKFYVEEEGKAVINSTVNRASITVVGVENYEGLWNVELIISSNATGQLKKTGMIVPVDAKSGMVVKEGVRQFLI